MLDAVEVVVEPNIGRLADVEIAELVITAGFGEPQNQFLETSA